MIKNKWGFKNKANENELQKELVNNPYLNARRSWNVHTAGLMKSVHLWQMIGIGSLLIALAAVGGVVSIGSQSKFIPLVFQQDANGNTLSVTRADSIADASIEDYRMAAARFIEDMRLVSADVALQKKAIFQVYSFLNNNDAALTKVQDFYSGKQNVNPFERAAHEIVSTEIRSVLQETEHSWQVTWIETVRGRDGALKEKPFAMKAILTLYQNSELKEVSNEVLLKNPHSLYVRDFNWSRDLDSGEHA